MTKKTMQTVAFTMHDTPLADNQCITFGNSQNSAISVGSRQRREMICEFSGILSRLVVIIESNVNTVDGVDLIFQVNNTPVSSNVVVDQDDGTFIETTNRDLVNTGDLIQLQYNQGDSTVVLISFSMRYEV